MTKQEILRRWQNYARKSGKMGVVRDIPWTSPDDLKFFLLCFAPDGADLMDMLGDVPKGPEIVERIIPLFTRMHYPERLPTLTASDVDALVRQHLKIAIRVTGLIGAPSDLPPDTFDHAPIRRKPGEREINNDLEQQFYEAMSDYFTEPSHLVSHASLLDEAIFTFCGDNLVRNHALWPLAENESPNYLEEPYLPYFKLWLGKIDFSFTRDYITVFSN